MCDGSSRHASPSSPLSSQLSPFFISCHLLYLLCFSILPYPLISFSTPFSLSRNLHFLFHQPSPAFTLPPYITCLFFPFSSYYLHLPHHTLPCSLFFSSSTTSHQLLPPSPTPPQRIFHTTADFLYHQPLFQNMLSGICLSHSKSLFLLF